MRQAGYRLRLLSTHRVHAPWRGLARMRPGLRSSKVAAGYGSFAGVRLGGLRHAVALVCLATAGLAAVGRSVAGAGPDLAPVVGIHFEDLAPGSNGGATLAVANPRHAAADSVSATSDSDCLDVAEPTNTRFEVWRVPAKLTRMEPCSASVTVAATYGAETWLGRVLVALYPLADISPLGAGSGLELTVVSGTDAYEDSGGEPGRKFDELALVNGSELTVRFMSLSRNPARDELLGSPFLRAEERGTRLRQPLPDDRIPRAGIAIPPGGRLTVGIEATANGRLTGSPTAVTLGLLPIVSIGEVSYYLETGLVTSFSWPDGR